MTQTHFSVLKTEVVNGLLTKKNGTYIDGTYGRGGHSDALLKALDVSGRLIALDRDHEAITDAKRRLGHDKRFEIYHCAFSQLKEVTTPLGLTGKVSGILLDLGVSSPQLDVAERGFSFNKDGALDMRMDQRQEVNAKEWVNAAPEREICDVLKTLGEERYARRIARAIVGARRTAPIHTTAQLAAIVSQAHPSWEIGQHPATKTFQAIRIHINRELEELEKCLEQCLDVLEVGGRLAVISFHSLEDRIVKRFIRQHSVGVPLPKEIPLAHAPGFVQRLKNASGIIRPSQREIQINPRSRSAIMRITEKLQ
ncbi:MAG: 16S rRNA (cytosine(1402)-N(4))-methyltransferase RsmH [Gammaproteobacteria bacterium]|nr:16S rRNA (cytosine(1402)-N(4))-methyltransferase RsmH [Gammaproteobacteria bacterium]